MYASQLELKKIVGMGVSINATVLFCHDKLWMPVLDVGGEGIYLETQKRQPRKFKTLDAAAAMLKSVGICNFNVSNVDRLDSGE